MLAESFERIHRSNLVGMGIIPLQYKEGQTADSLGLTGKEKFTIRLPEDITTGQIIDIVVSWKTSRHMYIVCANSSLLIVVCYQ